MIEAIAIAIAVLGIVLLSILFARLRVVDAELLALNGQPDEALRALADAVDDGWRLLWPWTIYGANLRSLRDRPEFARIESILKDDMARQRDATAAMPHMGEFDLRDKPAE